MSLSDIIRMHAEALNLKNDRDTLTETANQLKKEHGAGVLAIRCLERINDHDHVVFDSIRHPLEAKILKENRTYLIGVNAPIDIRYKRIHARQNSTDNVSFSVFKRQDEYESKGKSSGQSIDDTLALCDTQVDNSGDIKDLTHALDRILNAHQTHRL